VRSFRWLVVGIGSASFAVGATGALHLPAFRPALAWIADATGCPVSLNGADPVALEAHRSAIAHARSGTDEARSRPALGFELGRTNRADVQRALETRGAECESLSEGAVLRCRVPGSDDRTGELDAHVQFDPSHRLVAVDLWRTARSGEDALHLFEHENARLRREVGEATRTSGNADAGYLAEKPFRRAAREYRYSDYLAQVSVTNLGQHGIRLREQYQWVPPKS
jgi:hypothetical protein